MPTIPLHPEYELLLKQMAEVGGPALSEMPVEQGREMYRMMQPENPMLEKHFSRKILVEKVSLENIFLKNSFLEIILLRNIFLKIILL